MPRTAGVKVAIPFPRTDAVELNFALHLLQRRGFVHRVLGLIPVVVWSEVALTERALRACRFVDAFRALRHEPAWQNAPAARRAFGDFAIFVALLLQRR